MRQKIDGYRRRNKNEASLNFAMTVIEDWCLIPIFGHNIGIHAEVVAFVAGSLEAGGLPGYPEVLLSLK
jgi:hypothetical protein